MLPLLGWAWASPTLAWLHYTHVWVCVCLLAWTDHYTANKHIHENCPWHNGSGSCVRMRVRAYHQLLCRHESDQGEGLDKVTQVAPCSAIFSLPDLLMSCGVQIASFPGLPHFLFFGFPSVCPSTNSCAINDRASCLPVKSSTVDQSCEPQESWLSSERSMMKSSALFERGPLPPYVHLASTGCHSCDRCSQAFPIFHAASVYYTEQKPKNKKTGEAWERG